MGKVQRLGEVLTNNELTNRLRYKNNDLTINEDISLNTSSRSISLFVNIVNIVKEGKSKRNRHGFTPELARSKAGYLAQKLSDEKSLRFYLKCAWNLSDLFIDSLLELALLKGAPANYFSKWAAQEMARNN